MFFLRDLWHVNVFLCGRISCWSFLRLLKFLKRSYPFQYYRLAIIVWSFFYRRWKDSFIFFFVLLKISMKNYWEKNGLKRKINEAHFLFIPLSDKSLDCCCCINEKYRIENIIFIWFFILFFLTKLPSIVFLQFVFFYFFCVRWFFFSVNFSISREKGNNILDFIYIKYFSNCIMYRICYICKYQEFSFLFYIILNSVESNKNAIWI